MRQLGVQKNWNIDKLTVEDIETKTQEVIDRVGQKYDAVGKVSKDKISFQSVILPLIHLHSELSTDELHLDFLQHSVADKKLREASVNASKAISLFEVDMAMKKDVFDNVVAFKDQVGLDGLTEEQKRYVEKTIVDGKRNGLHLSQEEMDKVKVVKKKISQLGTQFSSNLNEDTTCLYFNEQELAGVPQDLVESFERKDGKCKVTMKYPHFLPVSRKCRIPETRRLMEVAYQSRCMKENTKILEQLVQLRQDRAQLLGYKNHAEFVHELRMAKNPEKVKKFLADLSEKLQPLWKEEKKEMLKLKEEECNKYGYEYNGQLDFWDMRYYQTMVEEKKYSVDQEKLKEYFPLDTVSKGLLNIYQQLLGLTFTEVTDPDKWHEDVSMYCVTDTETKETMGYFFLDLHPRDGKYGHAAIFQLQYGCIGEDGKRILPVCAMMVNFSRPTEKKPALLDHDEVETYFHEFGHVMHKICSRTETARFTGTNLERDFIEAPSQMLENWVWEEETLKLMSGHYSDGSPIPKEILDKLVASRIANAGALNLRQIILGTFDQTIHTRGEADTQKIFADTYKETMGVRPIENTNMPANFGHMVGYDAQYYGYMWSEVFSCDMFYTRFKKEGLLNPKVGADYRKCILQPGGSKDAIDLLRDFLGREPNQEAFLRSKGLHTSTSNGEK